MVTSYYFEKFAINLSDTEIKLVKYPGDNSIKGNSSYKNLISLKLLYDALFH
jgi:hypothetical protein